MFLIASMRSKTRDTNRNSFFLLLAPKKPKMPATIPLKFAKKYFDVNRNKPDIIVRIDAICVLRTQYFLYTSRSSSSRFSSIARLVYASECLASKELDNIDNTKVF